MTKWTCALMACAPILLTACAPGPTKIDKPSRAGVMEEAASSRSPITASGKPAPTFALLDQNSRMVHLADQKGRWVVLYFYPKDDTPGCTCQATEFTTLLGSFKELDAVVLGVSPDSPADHAFFQKKYDLGITLLSDPKLEVMRQYGAWVETRIADQTVGRVVRSTFLIDPDGRIAYHWPEVIPEGHAERVKQKLREMHSRS